MFDLKNDAQMREKCIGLDQVKYPDILNYVTWNYGDFKWKPLPAFCIHGSNPRPYDFRRRADPAVGRIYTVSARERERYCLLSLLLHQKGSSSYQELRKVNRVQHASFRYSCTAIGRLADDAEWRNALRESYPYRFHPLTQLFALIVMHCEPSNSLQLWSDHAPLFFSGIRHRYRVTPSALNCLRSDEDAKNRLLLK